MFTITALDSDCCSVMGKPSSSGGTEVESISLVTFIEDAGEQFPMVFPPSTSKT